MKVNLYPAKLKPIRPNRVTIAPRVTRFNDMRHKSWGAQTRHIIALRCDFIGQTVTKKAGGDRVSTRQNASLVCRDFGVCRRSLMLEGDLRQELHLTRCSNVG